ncbi:MAG: hypothetical protein SOX60_07390, partial [Prevotella sp.]|nr:hypothetical protein [Prevotella sp.]
PAPGVLPPLPCNPRRALSPGAPVDASAAQPAVMDIRHRRRRLLEIDEHYKHAKMLLCICESSIKKENKNKQN